MAAYLAALPNGIESYPGCLTKGAIVRAFLTNCIPGERLEGLPLPDRVGALLREPPASNSWVGEVETWASFLALRDLLQLHDERAWHAWFEPRNRDALINPILRLVMSFSSPETLLPFSNAYWAMTHKGTQLGVVEKGKKTLVLALEYPPGLFNEELARTLTVSYLVPLKLSGAKSPVVTLASWTPTRSLFNGAWE